MIRANQALLRQALALLDRLDDGQYAGPRGDWSPVGAQLRHVIEHYQCFLEGEAAGRIDYDARRRDPTIETSRARAAEAIDQVLAGLDRLRTGSPDHRITIQMRCASDAPAPTWTESTIGRELQFLVSHSVHHYALMKFLLAGDGVSLDEDFGTAPSTVAHARASR